MRQVVFVSILFIIIVVDVFGADLARYELSEMESVLQEELKKSKPDKEKLFYLYILTGREAYAQNNIGKAQIYYQKAISFNFNGDKTEAFINRMAISHQLLQYSRLEGEWHRAGRYFSNNPILFKRTKPLMEYYKEVINQKSKKDLQPYRGLFKWNSTDMVLKENIKNKHYLRALAAFDPTRIGMSKDWESRVVYDLLNVLVKKKKVKKLHCQKGQYSTVDHNSKICAILVSYLKNGKVDRSKMLDLEEYLKSERRNKTYFVDALKDI